MMKKQTVTTTTKTNYQKEKKNTKYTGNTTCIYLFMTFCRFEIITNMYSVCQRLYILHVYYWIRESTQVLQQQEKNNIKINVTVKKLQSENKSRQMPQWHVNIFLHLSPLWFIYIVERMGEYRGLSAKPR